MGCFWLAINNSPAQIQLTEQVGLAGGLAFELGIPVRKMGVHLQAYYGQDFIQVNGRLACYYVWHDLGPRPFPRGWEGQASIGALLGWGRREQQDSPLLSPVSNQLERPYAVSYAYNWYRDQRKTSQTTATIGVHIGRWQVISENDAFTGQVQDRFRTGTFSVRYVDSLTAFGLSLLMWTGDSRSAGTQRITDSAYPARFGYKDLSESTYGRFSHGVLAATVTRSLGYGQVGQLALGVDAEQVRHLLQNRLIHDMYWLPANWIKSRNVHYPMLMEDGRPYLYQAGQHIRPIRPYMGLSLNPGLFY